MKEIRMRSVSSPGRNCGPLRSCLPISSKIVAVTITATTLGTNSSWKARFTNIDHPGS
jgi:hypothetical protein